MASKALTIARKSASALRRKMNDERLAVGAGAGGGGVVARVVDRNGVATLSDDFPQLNTNLVFGLALVVAAAKVPGLPFRALLGGVGAGMVAVGAYNASEDIVPRAEDG